MGKRRVAKKRDGSSCAFPDAPNQQAKEIANGGNVKRGAEVDYLYKGPSNKVIYQNECLRGGTARQDKDRQDKSRVGVRV